MASEFVKTVNDRNFQTEVLEAQEPVLIDFTATWCGPCKALAPIVDDLAKQYNGKVKVAKLDIDDSPETPSRLGIRGVPTVIVFKGGREVGRQVGLASKAKIEALFSGFINPA
ncbi:MAG: thioredoxin [Polyangiales bacterium]